MKFYNVMFIVHDKAALYDASLRTNQNVHFGQDVEMDWLLKIPAADPRLQLAAALLRVTLCLLRSHWQLERGKT